jgi:UDP-N-acetyl-D-mannosaminuronic acid dehydrogenase
MSQANETVCVIGLGYIGLPTASLLASKGFSVLGVDVFPEVVETINQGRIHIVEPDLDTMVRAAVQSGNLTASLTPAPADVFIMAVPTPFKDGHEPDVTYLEQATLSIAPVLKDGDLVIVESTSPVGITERVQTLIETKRPELKGVGYAYCPERVLPGRILHELVTNDRVIGGVDAESTARTVAFYRKFVVGELLATEARTAEMCKLTENAFRDVNIAFANELSTLSDRFGIDVWELIRLANHHPRVNILQPGPGVGGHCIAVDPWFIVSAAAGGARLIETAREVNDAKPGWVLDQVRGAIASMKSPKVGCLGLAFKADIDDLRESPALGIVRQLVADGDAEVFVSEPNLEGSEEFELLAPEVVIERSDVVLLLVDHRPFKDLDPALLAGKTVIDTRGVWA